MSNVAVTGANGFLGKYVVDRLAVDHHVTALIRRDDGWRWPTEVSCRIINYTSADLLRQFTGKQAVVHLAARRPYRGENSQIFDNVRLDFEVMSAAERAGVEHFVFASTRGVYGDQPAPWSETCTPRPLGAYALAKLQSEQTAAFFAYDGLKVSVLRLSQIFGLGEYPGSAVSQFIEMARLGRTINIGVRGICREYTYVKDMACAIARVIDIGEAGTFNVGSGARTELADLARAIAAGFGGASKVEVLDSARLVDEMSFMDCSKFFRTFRWKPSFTVNAAADDVARQP